MCGESADSKFWNEDKNVDKSIFSGGSMKRTWINFTFNGIKTLMLLCFILCSAGCAQVLTTAGKLMIKKSSIENRYGTNTSDGKSLIGSLYDTVTSSPQ